MPSSLIAGLFLVAAAAALTVVAMSAVVADDQIIWGAIALAVFCTGLLLLMSATTGGDGFGLSDWRIGSWSLVWGALAFGLATITWIGSQAGTAAEILPASILRALWMLALAMAMLTAGSCAGPCRPVGPVRDRRHRAAGLRAADQSPWLHRRRRRVRDDRLGI